MGMPYTDRTALSVQKDATLRRAFALFRTLGLRHLPVVNSDGSLCGILTRKELILGPATKPPDTGWVAVGRDTDTERSAVIPHPSGQAHIPLTSSGATA